MLQDKEGTPVHFPANPQYFQFDSEVAKIFPDMAARSIPNFHQAHMLHVQMAMPALSSPGCRILDVGASRGHFYSHVKASGAEGVEYTAVDSSEAMCDAIRAEYPEATVLCEDASVPDFWSEKVRDKFDIICCNYTLQFMPVGSPFFVLNACYRKLVQGGYFFLGHKSQHNGQLGEAAHEQYIRWRMGNGYTRDEIEAKTKALKGSMFPMNHEDVVTTLRARYAEVQETTRFLMFSTLAARK